MLIWFFSLFSLGINSLITEPTILKSLNPLESIYYLQRNKVNGFLSIGKNIFIKTCY